MKLADWADCSQQRP